MRRFTFAVVITAFAAAAVPAQMADWPSFMTAFANAVKADDFAKQKTLVENNRKHIDYAFTNWERYWCQAALKGEEAKANSDYYMQVLETLAIINKSYGTRQKWLVDRVPWLRGLKKEQLQAKLDLITIRAAAWDPYQAALKNPSEAAIRENSKSWVTIAEKAKIADDAYWAADAYTILANMAKKIPDWYDVLYYYKLGQSLTSSGHAADKIAEWNMANGIKGAARDGRIREEFVDINVPLVESKKKYDESVAEATAKAAKVGGGGATGEGMDPGVKMPPMPNQHPGAEMAWAEVTGLKVGKARRPVPVDTSYFRANAHWFDWNFVQIQKGQTQPVPLLPGDTVIANDNGKLFLHPGGKGKGKPIRLKAGVKAKIREFKKIRYLDGSTGSVWHWMMEKPTTYTFNGFRLRSTGGLKTLLFRGATVASGKVRGEKIEIHDANGNGSFNDFGVDFITTGKGKKTKCQPMSKYITLKGLFYEFKIDANGRALRTRPYDGPIAPLKFDYKANSKPSAMIAHGSAADDSYYYDLMQAVDSPMWVVAGVHNFHEGYIARGKGMKRQTLWIRKGRARAKEILVGQLNTWKMGGAGDGGFVFHFKSETRKEKGKSLIVITGKDVKLFGSGGEEYARSMLGVYLPDVQIRKGKDGPVVVRDKMRSPETADLNETTDNMWFPKTMSAKKNFSGEFSVKMVCNYKPLGKVESEWIVGN
ncbi:MAG: hypothetical protein CMJ83_13355 [Planctomycetes bacterium]|nr:hypothetical protein [Planctomycetota bacterium]